VPRLDDLGFSVWGRGLMRQGAHGVHSVGGRGLMGSWGGGAEERRT
jgi:hypothetical protein